MTSKIPWVPSELQPGQKAERLPRLQRHRLIPRTLHRDRNVPTLLRTWVRKLPRQVDIAKVVTLVP